MIFVKSFAIELFGKDAQKPRAIVNFADYLSRWLFLLKFRLLWCWLLQTVQRMDWGIVRGRILNWTSAFERDSLYWNSTAYMSYQIICQAFQLFNIHRLHVSWTLLSLIQFIPITIVLLFLEQGVLALPDHFIDMQLLPQFFSSLEKSLFLSFHWDFLFSLL